MAELLTPSIYPMSVLLEHLRTLDLESGEEILSIAKNKKLQKRFLAKVFTLCNNQDADAAAVGELAKNIFYLVRFLLPQYQRKRKGFDVQLFGKTTQCAELVPGINLPQSLASESSKIIKFFSTKQIAFRLVKEKIEIGRKIYPYRLQVKVA